MADTSCRIKKLFDFIKCLVLNKKTGHLEINFSQGCLTKAYFKERLILEE
jgi:hypothetical protein